MRFHLIRPIPSIAALLVASLLAVRDHAVYLLRAADFRLINVECIMAKGRNQNAPLGSNLKMC